MALLWLDGFEDDSLWTRKYAITPGSGSIVPILGTGRANSGSCAEFPSSAASSANLARVIPTADRVDELVFGMAVKFSDLSNYDYSGGRAWFTVWGTGDEDHINCYPTSGGELEFRRASSYQGSTIGAALVTGSWYYIECHVKVGDSPNGFITVRVNGTEVLALTSIDTKNGGSDALISKIRFWASDVNDPTGRMFMDDFYICDTTGTDYNTFLGDIRVETLRPSGNGSSSDFTGSDGNSTDNYLLVDEADYDPAEFVESSTTGHKDKYAFDNMAHTTGTVRGVMALAVISKSDSGSKQARLLARTSATDYNGSTETLTGTDAIYSNAWEVNPNTASDWTISEVNGAEFGVEVV